MANIYLTFSEDIRKLAANATALQKSKHSHSSAGWMFVTCICDLFLRDSGCTLGVTSFYSSFSLSLFMVCVRAFLSLIFFAIACVFLFPLFLCTVVGLLVYVRVIQIIHYWFICAWSRESTIPIPCDSMYCYREYGNMDIMNILESRDIT